MTAAMPLPPEEHQEQPTEGYATAVGLHLKHVFLDAGTTTNKVRIALGWQHNYMSRRINGHKPFDVSDLAAIAAHLRVEVGALLPRPTETSRQTARSNIRYACVSSLNVVPITALRDRRRARAQVTRSVGDHQSA